jgi:hypothetical protein
MLRQGLCGLLGNIADEISVEILPARTVDTNHVVTPL